MGKIFKNYQVTCVDTAIERARSLRISEGRHYSVNQHGLGYYTVRPASKVPRPVWSTRSDPPVIRKLEVNDIPLILELVQDGVPISHVADKFDVNHQTVRNIRNKYLK